MNNICRTLKRTKFIFLAFSILFNNQLHAQWVKTNGPSGGTVHAIAINGTSIFAGTNSKGIYISTDSGTTWIKSDSGITSKCIYAFTFNGSNLFAGTYGGGIYLSTNSGTSWTEKNYGLTNSYDRYIISLYTLNNMVFAGTLGGVFRSTDNGATWSAVNSGLTNLSIKCLTAKGTNLFAGTFDYGIFRSTDCGDHWIEVNNSLTNRHIYSLCNIDTSILAGTWGGGILCSTNNGNNWYQSNTSLTETATINALYAKDAAVFAGAWSLGVFLSTNRGTNWTQFSDGALENKTIWSIASSNLYIFAGTDSIVCKRPLSDIISSVADDRGVHIPSLILNQNYPNPFNPSTNISFNLPSKSFTSLKIFDLLGQEVATLISEELPAGSYSRQWNAANMSSGLYFYRLQAGKYIATKKLVLIK